MPRRCKPARVKKLTGNPGKRAIRDTPEPAVITKAPSPPAWLDVEAKRKWKAIAPELVDLGLLTALDIDALAAYCQAWAEIIAATKLLRDKGRVHVTDNGYPTAHPAVGMQRSAMAALKAAAAQLGCDPASRTRLQLPPKPAKDDPLQALIRQAAQLREADVRRRDREVGAPARKARPAASIDGAAGD